jgi:hypothetical protein
MNQVGDERVRTDLRRAARSAAAALLIARAAPAFAADVVSQYEGAGLWSDPTHWRSNPSQPLYPNNGNGGLTFRAFTARPVTLDVDVNLESYTLSDWSLSGTNRLTVSQGFTFAGGTLSASVDAGGGIVGTIGATHAAYLVGGTIRILGSSQMAGNLQLNGAAPSTVAVAPGVTLTVGAMTFTGLTGAGEISNDGTIALTFTTPAAPVEPGWRIANRATGTFSLTASYPFRVAGAFEHDGLLDLPKNSTFELNSTVASRESRLSGHVSIATGAVFRSTGGTLHVSNVTFANDGLVQLSGGNTIIETPTVIPNKVQIGPSPSDFPPTVPRLTVNAPLSIPGPATWTGGTIGGTAVASFANLTGGGTIEGHVTVPAGGTLTGSVMFIGGAR